MGTICTPEKQDGAHPTGRWREGEIRLELDHADDFALSQCCIAALPPEPSSGAGQPAHVRRWRFDDQPGLSPRSAAAHLVLPDGHESGGHAVFLHLYDLSSFVAPMNDVSKDLLNFGGAFHVGLEVHGVEWSYGLQGIGSCDPKAHPDHVYRETVPIGRTTLGSLEVATLVQGMMPAWRGRDYDLLLRNCGSFCRALGAELGVGPVPLWVTRLSEAGGRVRSAFEHPSLSPRGGRAVHPTCAMRREHLESPLPPGVHAGGGESATGGGLDGCLSRMPRQRCSAFAFDSDRVVLNALVPGTGGGDGW